MDFFCLVTIPGWINQLIENHFDYSFELEHNLHQKGKNELLKEIQKVANLAKFVYVRQPFPLGDGHAILCAKELIKILGDILSLIVSVIG